MKFLCWENGVLQLVSEQVRPSGQVDESLCRVVMFSSSSYVFYVIMFNWLTWCGFCVLFEEVMTKFIFYCAWISRTKFF